MSTAGSDVSRSKWRAAGVELTAAPMTRASLTESLKKAANVVHDAHGRYVSTVFDQESDDVGVYPRAEQAAWDSAVDVLARYSGAGVMMRAPLFWQLEIPLFEACRKSGTFIFVNDRGNMPLGAAAIKRGSMQVVVTDADDANAFAQHLLLHGDPFPKSWLVIQKSGRLVPISSALTGSGSQVHEEIHAIPGLPIFVQCAGIIGSGSYHTVPEFAYEFGHTTYVTGPERDPLPLVRFDAECTAKEVSVCACGKTTYMVSNLSTSIGQ